MGLADPPWMVENEAKYEWTQKNNIKFWAQFHPATSYNSTSPFRLLRLPRSESRTKTQSPEIAVIVKAPWIPWNDPSVFRTKILAAGPKFQDDLLTNQPHSNVLFAYHLETTGTMLRSFLASAQRSSFYADDYTADLSDPNSLNQVVANVTHRLAMIKLENTPIWNGVREE